MVATEGPVSDAEFDALRAMQRRFSALPNKYARLLEIAYIHRASLRRYRPGETHPSLNAGEDLHWDEHRENWLLERWIVRERGVCLAGPNPRTLIDPISADEVRAAVHKVLATHVKDWAGKDDIPPWLRNRFMQAYEVETPAAPCRRWRPAKWGRSRKP
jgi:hypothetical protein